NMEKAEVFEVVKVTEEVESTYNQMEVTTPKKRKGRTQEDSVEKPKKPRSAYLLYYFDVHQIMQLGIPNMPQSEINKRISESWKRLSVAEKSYYLEKAKLEKEGIDTVSYISSLSPSKDLPGFRKILPRASYFLLSKGCSSNNQPGGSQSEVSAESLDSPVEGGSVSLIQEPQFAPLGLAGEVELSDHPVSVEDIAEETATVSHSMALQGIPPSSSSSITSKATASSDTYVSQVSADFTANGVPLKGNKTRVAGSGGAMVQQTQGEATQVVAIIPTQVKLKCASLSISQQNGSVKTYTRRGRGRCLNPGCSFMYVTRHKPPTCPECGSHLGGKWIPAVMSRESFSGLKPSTLKQLGQTVPTTTATQDLGLSTARGRGRCKNPSCDYMYKNRHKPAMCPKCGYELTQKNAKAAKVRDPLLPSSVDALSPAQKDIQRQNTLQLLRSSLQIPESDTELQETLTLIQELNSLQIVLVQPGDQEQENNVETETLVESGWPQFYESAATHCGLCNYPLFKGGQSTVAGQEDCWLLTETLMQTASLQLKVCLNVQCLALHSFTDLHPGLFNIGNRLLVSIDLFLKIRANIKQGHLSFCFFVSVHALTPDESFHIQELLLSGYWAFECLTVRDYNDMICGICGFAPKLEIAQRYTNNVLELKHVEFTWPEVSVSDEVHVDDFWLTMESEAIEQAAFPTDIPITRVDASIIAPFTPPLMRSATVINTEKDKLLPHVQPPSGDPSVLVRLIHDGQLRLDKIEDHSEDELRTVLDRCGVNIPPGSNKVCETQRLLCSYPFGVVVCASKYLVRGETARDHVDLLLSSRYWPPVYVCDCARQVALCADMQYPELATQMWGRNQGCFSDPFEKPEFVSCAELQDQPYSADLSLVAENQQIHPITKSSSCWLVHPPGAAQEPPAPEHHSLFLCKDLEPYISLAAYYYLYNRLVDFLTSRDIVSQQINQVVKACQPGEVVIRDALYRLGVAQINTEKEEDEGSGMEEQIQEEGTETYEVVLPE
uniref:HMG domain-containing protein 3-like n=1 Tax=Stegastes partitus TaxID=144197 RepID=A0A3B4ZHE3_9TELE